MEHLSMDMEHSQQQQEEEEEEQLQESIQWRRDKVLELSSQGHSQRDISKILQIRIGTVNRDLSYLRSQSKQKVRKYIDETLPEEYEKCIVGITGIIREAWNTATQSTDDKKERIHPLSLAKECYSMKLELLTNATVVDDAIRFVSQHSTNNTKKLISQQNDNQESKEPDYDEGNTDKQGEEEQEEQTGEISSTTNQVF